MKVKLYISLLLIFVSVPLLTCIFFKVSFGEEVDKVFLSISTFLFSIFTGFFVSRQASRFNKIRETVTKFDGFMSAVYRASGHISKDLQKDFAKTIRGHYKKIFETEKWNIHLIEKSSTLTSMHKALDKHVVEENVTKLANQSLGRVMYGLTSCQDVRKQMVALYQERIPLEQWVLIWFFALILIGTVSTLTSVGLLFPSVLKAAFLVSVLSVIFILYRLNNLVYSERIMGENSAQDVLDTIGGKK